MVKNTINDLAEYSREDATERKIFAAQQQLNVA